MTKRFYKSAGVAEIEGGFQVVLDGRPIHSPGGRPILTPTTVLAVAIAEEWAAQGSDIKPDTMPLMRLMATALDVVTPRLDFIRAELLRFAETDLLCHRAAEPPELVARQNALWQPLLDWAAVRFGGHLAITQGLMPVAQSPESIAAFKHAIGLYPPLYLTALAWATPAVGSLVIGLAMVESHVTAEEAFAVSQLDETWQIENWGEDYEAADKRKALKAELSATAKFISLLRHKPAV